MIKNSVSFFASTALAVTLATAFAAAYKDKKEKLKPYPLSTCAVSDEKLGGMGDPYVFAHEGREVKLCCKSCEKDFKKEASKIVKKIDAAAKKVKPYPAELCLVSDEKFGGDMGEPFIFIHEGREIKLCCESCAKDFKKDEAKFVKKWDQAAKKAKK